MVFELESEVDVGKQHISWMMMQISEEFSAIASLLCHLLTYLASDVLNYGPVNNWFSYPLKIQYLLVSHT